MRNASGPPTASQRAPEARRRSRRTVGSCTMRVRLPRLISHAISQPNWKLSRRSSIDQLLLLRHDDAVVGVGDQLLERCGRADRARARR